jgi:hypothetical protein
VGRYGEGDLYFSPESEAAFERLVAALGLAVGGMVGQLHLVWRSWLLHLSFAHSVKQSWPQRPEEEEVATLRRF